MYWFIHQFPHDVHFRGAIADLSRNDAIEGGADCPQSANVIGTGSKRLEDKPIHLSVVSFKSETHVLLHGYGSEGVEKDVPPVQP